MAGDWLKIEKATLDKPEVFEMAGILGIDHDAVIGKLLRVWDWFDDQSVDGNAPVTLSALLNRYTGCEKFTQAMIQVGWLVEENGMISIPNFDRHNGETAKKRALSQKRTGKHRSKCNAASVTNSVTPALRLALPEKRREEKNIEREESATLDSSFSYSDKMPMEAAGNMLDLERKIQGLRKGWQLPLTYAEQHAMMLNGRTLRALDENDGWRIIKNYYHAKIPQGMPEYRPPSRERFITGLGDVFRYAVEWESKQTAQRAPRAISAQKPTVQTEEDEAALKEFLKMKPTTMKI